uniref:hypothetical protein n=1 Tax=Ndongobacter massiliensis TaxID=1871025 RepID=UPI000930C994|nr:hypothetical protein [Ndongobacter massiliensis]
MTRTKLTLGSEFLNYLFYMKIGEVVKKLVEKVIDVLLDAEAEKQICITPYECIENIRSRLGRYCVIPLALRKKRTSNAVERVN